MSFQNIPAWERPVAQLLIQHCLKGGRSISVNDSEEWTVKCSRDPGEIKEAMFTSDDDYIMVHDENDDRLGGFWLIYNNGSEDDPMVLISDYTDNAFCQSILTLVEEDLAAGGGVPGVLDTSAEAMYVALEKKYTVAVAALAHIRMMPVGAALIAGDALQEIANIEEAAHG